MAQVGYKILLYFLRALVYVKRAAVWVWRQMASLASLAERRYQDTLGFRLYKIFFSIQNRAKRLAPLSWSGGLIEIFGRRGTLQILLFLIAAIIMIPHSKLSTAPNDSVPGRKTVLFTLVGPGDQNFSFDEEIVETIMEDISTPAGWREGAIVAETAVRIGSGIKQPQELTGTSVGGSALTKPTILPGNEMLAGDPSLPRAQTVVYTVKSGDVIGAIAGQYGLSIETILWANNLTLRSRIHPGDELKIPPVDGVVHMVKKGETVAKIAKLYNAKEQAVIIFNKLQSGGADIVAGEMLIIPEGVPPRPIAPPTPKRPTFVSRIAAPPPSVEAPAGSGYIWPAGVRRISQYFGLRHNGLDIAGPVGTPIYAVRDGVISTSKCGWNGGYGCYIVIEHGGGYSSLYGHNNQLFVNVGDAVTQGQTIAAMGSTGNSTGPHTHFEIRLNKKRLNPLQFVR